MSDRADFVRVKRSYVLTGTGNLIELARFSSQMEFDLSGIFPYLNQGKIQGKQKNVRDIEEFELNGSRDIEVQLSYNAKD